MKRRGKLVFPPRVPVKRLLLSRDHPLQVGVRKVGSSWTVGGDIHATDGSTEINVRQAGLGRKSVIDTSHESEIIGYCTRICTLDRNIRVRRGTAVSYWGVAVFTSSGKISDETCKNSVEFEPISFLQIRVCFE